MRVLLLVLALLPVAALAGPDPQFGSSVQSNVMIQDANPLPRAHTTLIEGGSGRRSSDAVARYQAGRQKPLLKINGKTDLGGTGQGEQPTVAIPLIQGSNN